MKNKRVFLSFFVCVTFCMYVGVQSVSANTTLSNPEQTVEVSTSEYQENLKRTTPISLQELIEGVKSGKTFVVLFGRTGCRYCRTFSRTLDTFLQQNSIVVYYLDLDTIEPEQINDETLHYFNDILNLKSTPTVELIKHSKLIHSYIGDEVSCDDLQTLTKYKLQNIK